MCDLDDYVRVHVCQSAERPVGVAQLDDRQLPARGIVHAQSPCFCDGTPRPRCYCMSNFTYVQSTAERPPRHGVNALASSARPLAGATLRDLFVCPLAKVFLHIEPKRTRSLMCCERYLAFNKQQKQQNAKENAQNHKPTEEVTCRRPN